MVVILPVGPPGEGVRLIQNECSVYINERCLGCGTLYISESRVSWVGQQNQVFSLEYMHISMHAVSKDLSVFPAQCLYLMIDTRLVDSEPVTPDGSEQSDVEEGCGEDSDHGMTEIRFVPEDNTKLQRMFEVMLECQALHPNPDDSCNESNENDEDGIFDDADSSEMMTSTSNNVLDMEVNGDQSTVCMEDDDD